MNIVILANWDIASGLALALLLPQLQQHQVSVWLSSAVGGSKRRAAPLQALKAFESNVNFEGITELVGEAPLVENAINDEAAIARMRGLAPELIISIRYGGILKENIISIPRSGVINLHSGRLPQYRGVMATFWAMLAGDRDIGATLHYISDGTIDTGGVLGATVTPVDYQASYLSNVLRLYPAGVDLITRAVAACAAGNKLVAQAQSEEGGYFSFPSDTELQCFAAKGLRLFDPRDSDQLD